MSGTQPDEPLTDAEVASLAQRGLLFDNIDENTKARDEALARMAAAAEGSADAMASRLDAARDHVATKRKEMLAQAAKSDAKLTDKQKAESDERMRRPRRGAEAGSRAAGSSTQAAGEAGTRAADDASANAGAAGN